MNQPLERYCLQESMYQQVMFVTPWEQSHLDRLSPTEVGYHVYLTHWGQVTHICVAYLTIIASDNDLSPTRRQAIIWTNAGILLIRPLGTNFSEILIEIHTFSFKKMHLKMSSAKRLPFCLGLNVLNAVSWEKKLSFWLHCNWSLKVKWLISWIGTSLCRGLSFVRWLSSKMPYGEMVLKWPEWDHRKQMLVKASHYTWCHFHSIPQSPSKKIFCLESENTL